jgi:glutamate-ammonia-ligase adenylyltransferase
VREIRRVKLRVEQERIPPARTRLPPEVGKGALTDVEFTVQLLQLQHGAQRPRVRTPGTIDGLHRLVDADCSIATTREVLEESYRFCERARNARYLVTGAPGDALPGGIDDLRIGRLLGFVENRKAVARRVPPRDASRPQGCRPRVLRPHRRAGTTPRAS